MPPPEWNRTGPESVASLALHRREADPPVARRRGARAEQAYLRARLRSSSAQSDGDAERQAAADLARALAARGTELDTATRLARRALVLGDDERLREELAGWFAGLGELALAAATLRPLGERLPAARAGRMMTRVAVHLGRAGDGAAAAEALEHAIINDPADPVAPELMGAIGAWAPAAVTPERAARAYLQGAERRDALGEASAAFEDLLRAFESCPASALAAERLAGALAHRGRLGAADEVLREHGSVLGAAGQPVHLWRMADAAGQEDLPRALGAACDAGLDASLDLHSALRALKLEPHRNDETPGFDELLERAGLFDVLAARLELLAESTTSTLRSRCYVALGRLYEGPLANAERAVDAWVEALAADPSSSEALGRLRSLAGGVRDQTPLIEAILRVGGAPDETFTGKRIACLRELTILAEQRLADPSLAVWVLRRLRAAGDELGGLAELEERLVPQLAEMEDLLAGLRAALAGATGASRLPMLRRAVAMLRVRPDRFDEYLELLTEIVPSVPEERAWQAMLERALARDGRLEQLESLLNRQAKEAPTALERERALIALCGCARRRGDQTRALGCIEAALEHNSGSGLIAGLAWTLAALVREPAARARALLATSVRLAPALRAVLASVAADSFVEAGELELARGAAEQAQQADPSLVRPVATLARVAVRSKSADLADALERAMGVIVPRGELCEALASSHEQAGDRTLVLAWTQRWLALRPGDPLASAALLSQVTRHGDAPRLADALAWLLSQPQPLGELMGAVTAALRRLAQLDPRRTGALARRALDVLGPRHDELRETLLAVADAIGEPGLAIAVTERWLASGGCGGERGTVLLRLAERRRTVNDADGAGRALVRALATGADPSAVLAELTRALPPRTADGEIALAEARAEALSASAGADRQKAARAWREFGAACWDLGEDPEGAIRAWERAVVIDTERGVERYARDLVEFAGARAAFERLTALAQERQERSDVARILAAAAAVALVGEMRDEALTAAIRAIEADASQADAVAVAERAVEPERVADLDRLYDLIADAALGRFGERAAHYRAARQLEKRGVLDRALVHAVKAFAAVPGQGVTFVVMARLAERTGARAELMRALERAAAAAPTDQARAEWLQRAAALTGATVEGRRQRVDVLFRALAIRSDIATVQALARALSESAADDPDDREILQVRLVRAVRELLPQLAEAEGARIAIELARTAILVFDELSIGLVAVERALQCDRAVEDFVRLEECRPRIVEDRDAARAHLARWVDSGRGSPGLGAAALDFAVELGNALEAPREVAELLLDAALQAPENRALATRAAEAVRVGNDSSLLTRLLESMPEARRAAALIELASSAERAGELDAAAKALQQALGTSGITTDDRRRVVARLITLCASVERSEPLLALLEHELGDSGMPVDQQIDFTRRLAGSYSTLGDAPRAMGLIQRLVARHPSRLELWRELAAFARQAGDDAVVTEALGQLVDRTRDPGQRADLLRELASLLEGRGDPRAIARWTQLYTLDPFDDTAVEALERDAERRGDYEEVVALLSQRASSIGDQDEVRRLRLRRAQVLEQRLGRHDEARTELEDLLAEIGDDLPVLQAAADLNQRLGKELRAAPLWWRASGVAEDRGLAERLARLACESFLRGGDVTGAQRVLEGIESWVSPEVVAELRVEVERRGEDPARLAQALEALAGVSSAAPEQRAAWLLEAARVSEAANDTASALQRANEAARVAPTAAAPQLIARLLEYRARGAGAVEEARVTVAELRGIETPLRGAQLELRAFLVAEALDVAVGAGAGRRELERAQQTVGLRPLVALGLAERTSPGGDVGAMLELYDKALAGDLRGLRRRGEVALKAARAAEADQRLVRAVGYLDVAAADAELREVALELRRRIDNALQPPELDSSRPPPALEDVPLPHIPEAPRAVPFSSVGRPSSVPAPPREEAGDGKPKAPSAEASPPAEVSARAGDAPPIEASLPAEASPPPAEAPSSREASPLAEVPSPAEASLPAKVSAPGGATPLAEASPPPAEAGAREPVAAPDPDTAQRSAEPPATPARLDGDSSKSEPVAPMAPAPIVLEGAPVSEEQPFPLTRRSLPPSQRPADAAPPTPAGPPSPPRPASVRPPPRDPSSAVRSRPPAPEWPGRSSAPPGVVTHLSEGADALELPVAPTDLSGSSLPPRQTETDFPPFASVAGSPVIETQPDAPLSVPVVPDSEPASSAPPASGNAQLEKELAAGSVDAGLELSRRLAALPGRTHDRVAVCRRMVALRPSDPILLDQLYDAALSDHNPVYAAAVEHVRCALVGEERWAPPLSSQDQSAELARAMVLRELGPAQEAFALVWEGASHVFKQDLSVYGITGVERVPLGGHTPVARTYAATARALGFTPPFYQRRAPGDVTIGVALLAQPSVIVTGEVSRPSPEFAYHLGAMVVAALPAHAILCGSTEEQGRRVLKALLMAFGPPRTGRSGLGVVANLAEVLWESVPARAQRRLRELCNDVTQLSYDQAIATIRQATRRAGLFVCGDLTVAAREVALELGYPIERGLVASVANVPEVADLVRLATSPEYAEVRWQPQRSARGPEGWSI